MLSSVWYTAYSVLFVAGAMCVLTWYCVYRVIILPSAGPDARFLTYPVIFLWAYGVSALAVNAHVADLIVVTAVTAAAFGFHATTFGRTLIAYARGTGSVVLSRPVVALALVGIGAFAIRVFYLYRIMSDPNCMLTGSDAVRYDAMARSFLAGENITDSYASGYWMFLAVIYKVFGTGYFSVGIVQCIISSVSCILLYYVGARIFNARAGLIAAVLSALNFLLVFSASSIGYQVMDVFYCTAVVLLALLYTDSLYRVQGPVPWLLLCVTGGVMACAVATRETNFFFSIILVVWMFLMLRQRVCVKSSLAAAAVVLISYCLVLAPFIVRNIRHTGVWYPVFTTYGASDSGQGRDKAFSHYYAEYVNLENRDLEAAGVDLFDARKTFASFMRSPGAVSSALMRNFTGKFANMFFQQGYGSFDLLFLYRLSDYYYAAWFYAYVLGIVGLVAAFRSRHAVLHTLGFAFIAYRTAVHLFTEAWYRHRASLEPFLLLYVAFGLYAVIAYSRRQEGRIYE